MGYSKREKIEPECVMDLIIADPTQETKKKTPITCSLRGNPTNKVLSNTTLRKGKEAIAAIDDRIGASYVFPSDENDPSRLVELPFGIVAEEDSPLQYQLTACSSFVNRCSPVPENDDHHLQEFPILRDDRNDIFGVCKGNDQPLVKDLSLTHNECIELEKNTRGQSTSVAWKEARKQRCTASNFGSIIIRQRAPTVALLDRIFRPKDISHVKQIQHGRKYESVARDLYGGARPAIKIYSSGLVVHPAACYLGASTDGHLVDALEAGEENGVLEIKCPTWKCVNEGLEKYLILNDQDGRYELNKTSDYYCQVQGQMVLTGVQWSDFVIYVHKSEELLIERIYFDREFCSQLLIKLTYFYMNYAIPYLLDNNKENI